MHKIQRKNTRSDHHRSNKIRRRRSEKRQKKSLTTHSRKVNRHQIQNKFIYYTRVLMATVDRQMKNNEIGNLSIIQHLGGNEICI